MEVQFGDDDLERLEMIADFYAGFGKDLVRAYRKKMQVIRAATDERDFRAMWSLNFEKLKGGSFSPTLAQIKRTVEANCRNNPIHAQEYRKGDGN